MRRRSCRAPQSCRRPGGRCVPEKRHAVEGPAELVCPTGVSPAGRSGPAIGGLDRARPFTAYGEPSNAATTSRRGVILYFGFLREICGWIRGQNTRKYLLCVYLRQSDSLQNSGASFARVLRSRPVFAHHRLSAIPLGQRRSTPRSLFKESSPKASPYLGGDASIRPDPLDRPSGRRARPILTESTHKNLRRAKKVACPLFQHSCCRIRHFA